MSKASTTRTIHFISKAGTYTALIMSPSGDLYQEWEGTEQNVTKIYPNFEKTQPKLNFVCTSSRVAEGVATPDSMEYYFNDTKIEFSGDTSTGTFAGYFKKFAPSGDNLYYGLQILKNIVELSGFASATIKMVAGISYGTQSDKIQATYTIPIQPSTGSSYRVTIVAGDDKGFVITEKGGSCKLKAVAIQGDEELTENLTYRWEKMEASDWTVLSETKQVLTVSGNDIDTYGEFRVTVFREGTELGKDIQGVMDASDPYEIDAHPSPADEAITEDESGNDKVTYTPWIVKRGTSVQVIPGAKFFFVVKDAAGVLLNKVNNDNSTAVTSYAVTRAMCIQAGGDVAVTITSQD